MSKLPGPYQPLNGGTRGPDDPPPYSEVDPTHPVEPAVGSSALPYIPCPDDGGSLRTRGSLMSPSPLPEEIHSDSNPAVVTRNRGVPLASKSIDVVCPHCRQDIRTSIEKRPGLLAYLSGAVMACLCCFCGCCLIPCCIEECMEVKHTCPNCDGLIGKYRL